MRSRDRRREAAACAALCGAALSGCAGPQSALDPAGPAAGRIGTLTWILFAMSAVVTVLVLVVLALAVRRDRQQEPGAGAPPGSGRSPEARALRWVLLGGAAFPALVITPLYFYSVLLHGWMEGPAEPELTVHVEGRQWWWVVRYLGPEPQLRVTAANEIHVPAGARVEVRLTSVDVIHSFWVPPLQGKTDLIPGRETVTWIQAEGPGVWRGQCAEYCGLQHAHMALEVVAHEPAEFEAWLARERAPVEPPEAAPLAAGYQAFLQNGCGVCHTIRGTPARGTIGPDLTHVASRRTLAAGTLPNTRGNLHAWIADPQVIKPGNRMPRVPLAPDELHAIVEYLETLR